MASINLSTLINPTPKQRLALKAIDEYKFTLYGGARGGGKSRFLRWAMVKLLVNWYAKLHLENVRVGIFCEDYPALEDRQISKIKVEFPEWLGAYNATAHEFRLRPEYGSGVICFRNLDAPEKYLSAEFAAIGVDELTQNKVEVFDQLRGSLRWPGIEHTPFLAASNPGGIGHLWVKQYFIDKVMPKEMEFRLEDFHYVPATVYDNPYLPKSYIDELDSLPDRLRRAYKEGDWNVFEGQVFDEWRTDLHQISYQFKPPKYWRLAAGCDWGYRNPGWFGIAALGPDQDVVFIKELYFKQLSAYDVGYRAGMLCRMLAYQVEYVACDEQMWYESGAGMPTIAEEFQRGMVDAYGGDLEACPKLLQAAHGPGSRMVKLQLMHRYLSWSTADDGTIPPWLQPRLKFTAECRNAIRTIPVLPYSKTHLEDVDTDAEDHPYDGVTALLMSRPPLAERPERGPERDRHPGITRGGRRRYQQSMEEEMEPPGDYRTGFQVPRTLEPEHLDV